MLKGEKNCPPSVCGRGILFYVRDFLNVKAVARIIARVGSELHPPPLDEPVLPDWSLLVVLLFLFLLLLLLVLSPLPPPLSESPPPSPSAATSIDSE